MRIRGQGATEYLVLLAVVLIIALVGVALLGFFPGTANDAQITESQIYWRSASPIAITEWDARYTGTWYPTGTVPYLRIRNTGNYPLRITKLLGPGDYADTVYLGGTSYPNISSVFYLAPGEESYFGRQDVYGLPANRQVTFNVGSTVGGGMDLFGLTSRCDQSGGTMVMPSFGFEYVQYVEGQEVVKREIGKALVIKCRDPYN